MGMVLGIFEHIWDIVWEYSLGIEFGHGFSESVRHDT